MAQKREDAVSKEVTRKLSEADNRKMSRKEKDERCVCQVLRVELFDGQAAGAAGLSGVSSVAVLHGDLLAHG